MKDNRLWKQPVGVGEIKYYKLLSYIIITTGQAKALSLIKLAVVRSTVLSKARRVCRYRRSFPNLGLTVRRSLCKRDRQLNNGEIERLSKSSHNFLWIFSTFVSFELIAKECQMNVSETHAIQRQLRVSISCWWNTLSSLSRQGEWLLWIICYSHNALHPKGAEN